MALTLRVSDLAEALVSGVLRALDARKEFALPAGSIVGGCIVIPDGDNGDGKGKCNVVRVAITYGRG